MSTQAPRPLSELLTRTPDNTSGLITAENLRDAIVSLYPARGALEKIGAPVATTFTSPNTYVPLAATTALDDAVCTSCVEQSGNGQLRWLKPAEQVLLANATLAVLPSANNVGYTFSFAVNGTPVDVLAVPMAFGNLQGRPAGVFLSGLVRIQPNDVLSVVVRADGHTNSITTSVLTLSGVGFLT
jgi:hypothetical protein